MFIPKILKITDWKTRLVQDRTKFLGDIIKSFLINIPFQNVTAFGSVPMLERKTPGVKDGLDACFRGYGGLCGHTNHFMKMLLESLGYDAHIVSAIFRRTGIPSSHLACIVRIPYTRPTTSMLGVGRSKEKLYFVDVGCGVPIHEPILVGPMKYHGRAGGLDYIYEKTGGGHLRRVNMNGDAILGPKPSEFVSPQDYSIDLNPKKGLQHFTDSFALVFKSYDSIFMHQGFYLFRYLEITDNDFKIVLIRGKELSFVTRETRTVKTFEDIRDLEPHIHEYFPMINPQEVELSMINFSEFQNERRKQKQQKSA